MKDEMLSTHYILNCWESIRIQKIKNISQIRVTSLTNHLKDPSIFNCILLSGMALYDYNSFWDLNITTLPDNIINLEEPILTARRLKTLWHSIRSLLWLGMQGWKLDGAEIGDLPPRWLQALKCYLEKYYKLFFCNICRVVLGARGTDHLEVATDTLIGRIN